MTTGLVTSKKFKNWSSHIRIFRSTKPSAQHHPTPVSLKESSRIAGVAPLSAETRKHAANDPKSRELGWICIPMAVEMYGNWGKEAQKMFSRLATYLAIHLSCPKSSVLAVIYGRLNICLVRAVARAILGRGLSPIRL